MEKMGEREVAGLGAQQEERGKDISMEDNIEDKNASFEVEEANGSSVINQTAETLTDDEMEVMRFFPPHEDEIVLVLHLNPDEELIVTPLSDDEFREKPLPSGVSGNSIGNNERVDDGDDNAREVPPEEPSDEDESINQPAIQSTSRNFELVYLPSNDPRVIENAARQDSSCPAAYGSLPPHPPNLFFSVDGIIDMAVPSLEELRRMAEPPAEDEMVQDETDEDEIGQGEEDDGDDMEEDEIGQGEEDDGDDMEEDEEEED